MFNKNLGTCPLTDDSSNSFFTNIVGYGEWHFKRDYTFLALTRALLLKRLKPEDGEFRVKIRIANYSSRILSSHDPERIFDAMVDNCSLERSITLCYVTSEQEAAARLFDMLDHSGRGFAAHYRYREAADLRQFVGQHHINARFYFSDENKSTVIIVDQMELRSYHFLTSLMPRYIKWYLQEQPLDEEEIQLCKSLTDRYPLKFEKMITEFCSRIDFRTHRIKRMVGDFEKRSRRRQLQNAEREVDDAKSRVENNMAQYMELIRHLDQKRIAFEGIKQMINSASDSSELVEFFIRNKYINPTEANDRRLGVIIHSYLDVFDPEMARRMIGRDSSVMLSGYGISDNNSIFRPLENRRKFLTALFSDEPLFKIRTCAHFRIELNGEVIPSRDYSYPIDQYKDMMPNPHLDRYECLGQNRDMMRKRLLAGDTVGCLMQCVASTKCLNMADTTVVGYFMSKLFHSTAKVIELPDKTCVTCVQAFEWMLNQEKATEEPAETQQENHGEAEQVATNEY